MKKVPLISPIMFDECPSCGGKLFVLDSQSNVVNIDDHGNPIAVDKFRTSITLTCSRCFKMYPGKKDNGRYHIASVNPNILEDLDMRKRNPFGYTNSEDGASES